MRCIRKFLTRFRFTSLTTPVYARHFRSNELRLKVSFDRVRRSGEKRSLLWKISRGKVVRELRVQWLAAQTQGNA